ncbi:hypothetical protein TNCV_1302961 [Trichonephila clavipes]|nr:hypothetical protein TNCV_1302961 [Trichonephila clavipes]
MQELPKEAKEEKNTCRELMMRLFLLFELSSRKASRRQYFCNKGVIVTKWSWPWTCGRSCRIINSNPDANANTKG